ncbi:MAG TPA: hypothetical protein VEA63_02725, partial [Opitutus sp.]|nr:hypothetical protein [Opitutus sp.]
ALKDEPAILFIEMINEPHHHANDFAGSVAYINALAQAVRDTGCEKILFHNLSQDFRIAPAIAASNAQGFSFGWYPTALGARRTLTENYLRWVDRYTPLHDPAIPPLPRIVYEFDSADMTAGYMYPAMVRAYREAGAQFAAMFAYDMLATAPYNLGWQTHYLNLVHSPRKAVSAIIAAEAMRTLPRGQTYGDYPHNRHFGPFRVSYEDDTSELVTAEKFLHANDTTTAPPNPATLQRIVGVGSSPVVRYDGLGSYFLDKLDDGHWRLEVYPDAVFVQDPFAQRLNHETVSSRLIWRTWPMQLDLPDLGPAFSIEPLNADNPHRATARNGMFSIRPGVYLISRDGAPTPKLPERIGHLDLREFVCPSAPDLPAQIVPHLRTEYPSDQPLTLAVDLVAAAAPRSAVVHLRSLASNKTHATPLRPQRSYRYTAEIAAALFSPGPVEIFVVFETADGEAITSSTWTAHVVEPNSPVVLLDPTRDANLWFTLRTATERPGGYVEPLPAESNGPDAVRLHFPTREAASPHVISLPIKTRVADRGAGIREAIRLRVTARGTGRHLQLSLIDADGRTWSAVVAPPATWQPVDLPLASFRPASALKLPQGYPGTWNRELLAPDSTVPASAIALEKLEHLQISAAFVDEVAAPMGAFVDLASVEFLFD